MTDAFVSGRAASAWRTVAEVGVAQTLQWLSTAYGIEAELLEPERGPREHDRRQRQRIGSQPLDPQGTCQQDRRYQSEAKLSDGQRADGHGIPAMAVRRAGGGGHAWSMAKYRLGSQ